jgi:hypothetical protein
MFTHREERSRRNPRYAWAAAGGILVNEDGRPEGLAQEIRLEDVFRLALAEAVSALEQHHIIRHFRRQIEFVGYDDANEIL